MRSSAILTLLLLALPLPASAQRLGIAFVQAPEQSYGVATGATATEAFDAAVAQCVEGGALAEDCLQTNWCFPAGWSIDVFAQHQEGLHWHETLCGLPSKETATEVAETLCNRSARPYLIECSLVQIYDPEGVRQTEY